MADRSQLLNELEEGIRISLDGRQAIMWTACPGIVESVNFEKMTLSVQPAIRGVVFDEENNRSFVKLPLLIEVPIVYPSAGGFTITFPIAQGDEVLVVFASRCIDAWWQSGGIQNPMELRMHDLSDGFAIPGPRSIPRTISDISSTDCQIRNDAGTSYIGLKPNGDIELVAPNINVTGNLNLTGDVDVTGKIDATQEIKSGLIPLTTHTHATNTNPSGPPLP